MEYADGLFPSALYNGGTYMYVKSKAIPFDLEDGTTIDLTLNFKRLLDVRNKRKDIYKRYNQVFMDGLKDALDGPVVLYTAYLCGIDNIDTAMSEDAFLELLPPFPGLITDAVISLMKPKKKTDSEEHSEKRPEDQNEEE